MFIESFQYFCDIVPQERFAAADDDPKQVRVVLGDLHIVLE